MDIFDENRPEFSGINKLYRDDILPKLIAMDMERRRALSTVKKIFVLIAILFVLITFFAIRTGAINMVIFGAGAAIVGAFTAYSWKFGKLSLETKQTLVAKICQHIGWNFHSTEFIPIPLDVFLEYGLLSRPDRSRFEDQMWGLAHGCAFRLNEAHLEKKTRNSKGGTNWSTIFRGVLIEIDFTREFLGQTLIMRDAGLFNRKKRGELKRVGLVDPVFEKIFECYGTDQVEARYLLTPTFMQRLVDLETLLSGKRLRAGFVGGKLHIAISAPNQFEAGSMFKPLTDTARTQKILDEIGTVFDIVDMVAKR